MICPQCHRDTEPAPRIAGERGYFGEARFCTLPTSGMGRCEADLVALGAMPVPPRKAKPAEPSEATRQAAILKYLQARPDVFAWRNSVGAAQLGDRHIRFGLPGSADILAVWRGRFLAVEVKAARGKQSPKQQAFERRVVGAGGLYVLARSVDDVRAVLEAA